MSDYDVNKKWANCTGLTLWGVSIQTAFLLIGQFIGLFFIFNFSDIMLSGVMPSVMSGSLDYYEDRMAAYGGGMLICTIISFLGYILYIIGICLFPGAQISADAQRRARNIMLVELIMPALLILLLVLMYNCADVLFRDTASVVMLGIAVWGGSLAAVIILICQYKALSHEDSWSKKARNGADKVKTSYLLVIWVQVVVILGLIIMVLVTWSHFSRLNSMSYDGYQAVGSAMNTARSLYEGLKVVAITTSIVVILLSLFSTIARIAGWSMIKNGGLKVADEKPAAAAVAGEYVAATCFCHKCGTRLPDESAFCPVCGAHVAVTSAGNSVPEVVPPAENVAENVYENQIPADPGPGYAPEYDVTDDEEEEKARRRKLLLYGGIAAGVIVIALVAWMLSGSHSSEDDASASDTLIVVGDDADGDDIVINDMPAYSAPAVSSGRSENTGSRRYEGAINGRYRIVMDLDCHRDGSVTGTYYYTSTKVPVHVHGEIGYDGSLTLYGDYGSPIKDTFVGRINDYEYSGTWIRADGEKEWPFRVTR